VSDELKKAVQELTANGGLPENTEFDVVLPQELSDIVKAAISDETEGIKDGLTALIKAVSAIKNELADLKSDGEALAKSLVGIGEAADLIKGKSTREFEAKRADPATASGAVTASASDVIAKSSDLGADPREQSQTTGALSGEQTRELGTLIEKARSMRDSTQKNPSGFKEILPAYEQGRVTVEQFEALKKGVNASA